MGIYEVSRVSPGGAKSPALAKNISTLYFPAMFLFLYCRGPVGLLPVGAGYAAFSPETVIVTNRQR
jgi:hypothetical protein